MFIVCTFLPKQIPCLCKLSWRINPILILIDEWSVLHLKSRHFNREKDLCTPSTLGLNETLFNQGESCEWILTRYPLIPSAVLNEAIQQSMLKELQEERVEKVGPSTNKNTNVSENIHIYYYYYFK